MTQDNPKAAAAGPIISGAALIASMKAAETPVLGEAVKMVFFKQLGLDKLFAIDLRQHPETAPAALPTHEHLAESEDV